jgi:hypothetical protein
MIIDMMRVWHVALVTIATLALASPDEPVGHNERQAVAPSYSAKPPLAVVFGDSLITQAGPQLASDLSNFKIDHYATPAVAACFYLPTVKKFLKSHKPRVAIIEFWGNDTTTCIKKYPYESPDYFAEYKANVSTMTQEFVKAGAHVFLIGTIPDAAQVVSADPLWGRLNEVYAAIARSYKKKDVSFVNIQRVVESDGNFTWYLPCLAREASCDATISGILNPPPPGNNIVRSVEGLHFCPLYPTTSNALYNFIHCRAYASGTIRYAGYLADAVEGYLKEGVAPKYIGNALPAPNTPELGTAGQVDPYTGDVYPQA